MGVLNFSTPLQRNANITYDILSFVDNEDLPAIHDDVDVNHTENLSRTKRKRSSKYGGTNSTYDFRDLGVDKRRNGTRHQRRRENLTNLLEFVGEDFDEDWMHSEDCMTVFAELFLDETKMKVWEGFINLPEEKQRNFLDSSKNSSSNHTNGEKEVSHEEECYLLIDEKIRDMMRSKQLANNGLLEYYESDMMSCLDDTFPSVLILNLQEKYDRMLIYGLCQYFGLTSDTIRLKDSTLIEIEINEKLQDPPELKLTEFMRQMKVK